MVTRKQANDIGAAIINGKPAPARSYSAKRAAAGKDIGKPGKNFAKISDKAAQEYGSEKAGDRVAGAVLAKLRKGK